MPWETRYAEPWLQLVNVRFEIEAESVAANDESFFQEIGEVWSENLLLNVYIKLNADAKKDLYTRTRISFLFFIMKIY